MSVHGTFETYQPALRLSAYRGRPEVIGARSKWDRPVEVRLRVGPANEEARELFDPLAGFNEAGNQRRIRWLRTLFCRDASFRNAHSMGRRASRVKDMGVLGRQIQITPARRFN
jgi:hypothetical protein